MMNGMVDRRTRHCAGCLVCGKMIGKYSGAGTVENVCSRCKTVVVVRISGDNLVIFPSRRGKERGTAED